QEAVIGVTEARSGAGIRLASGSSPSPFPLPRRLPGFEQGAFIVQDPAHMLVCRYAAFPAGGLAYDACAAPGGKAVMLERLGARVVAGDARRDRMAHLVQTVRRAGVAIRPAVADLLAAPCAAGALAAVLDDAPCTATGTLERHPEFRRDAPPPGTVPAELLTEAGDFQSIPQRHGIDGAYAARLVRVR